MKPDAEMLILLKEAVERTYGRTPGSPSDFDNLSARIAASTHESLGVSTLKRFWGYVKSHHNPTYTTLSVLARYAGFRDWHSFCDQFKSEDESDFMVGSIVMTADLEIGAVVVVGWGQGKGCEMVKIAQPGQFRVLEATNIKLRSGDHISLHSICVGEKFFATDCYRGEVCIGSYLGARKEGIERINVRGTLRSSLP